MLVNACIEKLLSTPPKSRKRRAESVDSTPQAGKSACMMSPGVGLLPDTPRSGMNATPQTNESILVKLFQGLERVLVYLASRKCRPTLYLVRKSVETTTGRDLSDERLEQILGLAGKMFELCWIDGAMEIKQIITTADGKTESRCPVRDELQERLDKFSSTVDEATRTGATPKRTLPVRPESAKPPSALDLASTPGSNRRLNAQASDASMPPPSPMQTRALQRTPSGTPIPESPGTVGRNLMREFSDPMPAPPTPVRRLFRNPSDPLTPGQSSPLARGHVDASTPQQRGRVLTREASGSSPQFASPAPRRQLQRDISDPGSAPPPSPGQQRLDELRNRILLRQASLDVVMEHAARLREAEQRVAVCENAIAAHRVVSRAFVHMANDLPLSLTDVGSATTEAEVLAGITAAGHGMQSRRPISADAARLALTCLIEHACDWFEVRYTEYSQNCGGNMVRPPGSNGNQALASLQAELRRRIQERDDIAAQSPGSNVAAVPSSAAPAAAVVGVVAPAPERSASLSESDGCTVASRRRLRKKCRPN